MWTLRNRLVLVNVLVFLLTFVVLVGVLAGQLVGHLFEQLDRQLAESAERAAARVVIDDGEPRLRAVLCAKGLCDANGVPVELPKIEAFRQPAQP